MHCLCTTCVAAALLLCCPAGGFAGGWAPPVETPPASARDHTSAQSAAHQVSGVVVDAAGAPVAGASIRVEIRGAVIADISTGADGRFRVPDVPLGDTAVRATASGFAETIVRVPTAPADPGAVRIVLQPAPLFESVTVTAVRGAARLETPASTSVVTSAELLNSAAGTLDDALRNTPGFSLFRRSSSRLANPTTQGVTLRGVSGSGASRTLVLADGLPLNDPFGSWVYWNRIPQAAIDRVEVVRGATGDLYGADALGGVVQVLTFPPDRRRLRAIFDGGSHDTARMSLYGAAQARGWTAAAAGEWLDTDGVREVSRDERGRVDVPATSDYRTAFASVGYAARAWHASGRGSVYAEDRGNGTPIQVNTTDWRQLSGEIAGPAAGGVWQVRAAGGTQSYFQTFSAVANDRNSERLTNRQRTPSTFTTAAGQWARPWRSHVLLVGGEGKRISSTVEETRFSFAGVRTGPVRSGGNEVSGAVFGRASVEATDRLTIAVGAREEIWRSDPLDRTLSAKSVDFFSPRASLSWRVSPEVGISGSVYRAYRTPSLNELHRGFRVGNIVTTANPLLEPERLTGMEGGLLVSHARASARVTGFWNHLDGAIANITLGVTPTLITRQRQNAGRVSAAGVEAEADFRPSALLSVSALAVFTDARFRDAPALPALEGNRVPQVPRFQVGGGVVYADPRVLTTSAQVRIIGSQFEDDQNELDLRRFAVVDIYASRGVGRGLHAFVAVENLFDVEYDVGRTPVRTVGWPRTVRGGVRVFLP